MVFQKRRNPKTATLAENAAAQEEAKKLHATIMSRMLPLEIKAEVYLVPIGYDILENRRVRFQKRKIEHTGVTEWFLPESKLERVIVIKYAVFKDRRYYLVFSSTGAHTRIVWGGYCAETGKKELAIPYVLPSK